MLSGLKIKILSAAILIISALFILSAYGDNQPVAAQIGKTNFIIPAGVNVVYVPEYNIMKFHFSTEALKIHGSIDYKREGLKQFVRVRVSDIQSSYFGRGGAWKNKSEMPDSACDKKSINNAPYLICPSSDVKHFTIKRPGEDTYLVANCMIGSTLPNPVCEVNSILFDNVGATYTFNIKHHDQIILFDNNIRDIMAQMRVSDDLAPPAQ